MGFQVTIRGVEQATAELQQAVLQGERVGLERVAIRGMQLVQQNWPVGATGLGAHSVAMRFQGDSNPMVATIFEGAPADVYATPVEEGSKPHFPPPQALLLWVRNKIGETDEKKALSIAFAIARTIARRGTAAQHMFARSLEELEPEVQGLMEKALAEQISAAGLG